MEPVKEKTVQQGKATQPWVIQETNGDWLRKCTIGKLQDPKKLPFVEEEFYTRAGFGQGAFRSIVEPGRPV
ncbi:hypothetical protein VNO78_32791 [Psophocarpus tetragonolobus]|uniref:Uncharacterized protein n=1 Tax=Psophocarpus tetragonolobus TaxID=3891 RepID=A0AAN9RS50_PSOTE